VRFRVTNKKLLYTFIFIFFFFGNNEKTRIKSDMIGTDNPIPPLYGLRKDHKPCQDDTEGPPVRPVCGAAASYGNRLSHIISMILTELCKSKKDNAVCVTTEEMIAEMRCTLVLSQAVLRVLLNCSPLLPRANVVEKAEEVVLRMQYSGYNKKFRYEVVDSAVKAY